MTPQEQPDSQAADIEKSLRHGVNGGILDIHRISMSGDSQAGDELDEAIRYLKSRTADPITTEELDKLSGIAERLATERAEKAVYDALWRLKAKNEPAWKYAEDMAVVGVGYINQELATLTKEEHHA